MAERKEDTEIQTAGNSARAGGEDALIQAAKSLYHQQGYGRVKFSQIAKAAGLEQKDARRFFPSQQELCHQVIKAHKKEQQALFEEISQNGNPRQRLALYMDHMVDNAGLHVDQGCAITNLYFDTKREDGKLALGAAGLIQDRLDWIRDQFVVITHVEKPENLAERLACAIQGIYILAQVSHDANLIRNQVNQLKSWIRSM